MPLVGEFHDKFWNLSDTSAAPVHIGRSGYPGWQATVIAPSLFGVIGAWLDVWLDRIRWWRAFVPRVHRLKREQRTVLLTSLTMLESEHYDAARTAVRKTAVTLGFNRHEAWLPYSRELKSDPGRAENVYRHLHAMRLLRESVHSTLSNAEQNFVVELAYQGFARKGS